MLEDIVYKAYLGGLTWTATDCVQVKKDPTQDVRY